MPRRREIQDDFVNPLNDLDYSSSEDSAYSADSSDYDSSDLDVMLVPDSKRKKRRKRKDSGDESWDEGVTKKKRKRKTAAGSARNIPPEIRELIGLANTAYIKRDYNTAIDLLEEAVRLAPGIADPFLTLGAIHEELGDNQRSVEALLLAVHMTPGDAALWQRIATLSKKIGDIDQAIYCYSRCLRIGVGPKKDNDGDLVMSSEDSNDEELKEVQRDALWNLSVCYSDTGEYEKAIKQLRKLYKILPNEHNIGKELARCLYQTGEKEEAAQILQETYISQRQLSGSADANLVNMLCEVLLDLREWVRCLDLLSGILDLQDLNSQPADLVSKFGIAVVHSDKFKHLENRIIDALIFSCSVPVEFNNTSSSHASPTSFDIAYFESLAIPFADALIDTGKFDQCVQLIQASPELTIEMGLRMGRCFYEMGKHEEAVSYLESYMTTVEGKLKPDFVMIMADVLRHLNRQDEADKLMLESLSYEDLKSCRQLPKALSNTARRQIFDRIQGLLSSHYLSLVYEATPLRERFIDQFLSLMWDTLYDFHRVERYRTDKRPDKAEKHGYVSAAVGKSEFDEGDSDIDWEGDEMTENPKRGTSFWKLRKELDLFGVDTFISDEEFVIQFLSKCAIICLEANRQKELIELFDKLLSYKRKRWNQKSVTFQSVETLKIANQQTSSNSQAAQSVISIVEASIGKTLTYLMEAFLFGLSSSTGMNKLRLKFLRSNVVNALVNNDEQQITQALAEWSKTVFVRNEFRNSHRELMDERAWLLRQAVKYPFHYGIFMSVGHFCVYTSKYKFAMEEYDRAVFSNPADPLAHLCLASSTLSVAMSRTTSDKDQKVLKAWYHIQQYGNLKRQQSTRSEKLLAEMEVSYNQGRAAHQLLVRTAAYQHYTKALSIGKEVETEFKHDLVILAKVRQLKTRVAYALGTMHQFVRNIESACDVIKENIVF